MGVRLLKGVVDACVPPCHVMPSTALWERQGFLGLAGHISRWKGGRLEFSLKHCTCLSSLCEWSIILPSSLEQFGVENCLIPPVLFPSPFVFYWIFSPESPEGLYPETPRDLLSSLISVQHLQLTISSYLKLFYPGISRCYNTIRAGVSQ